jgi:hypothetical protein
MRAGRRAEFFGPAACRNLSRRSRSRREPRLELAGSRKLARRRSLAGRRRQLLELPPQSGDLDITLGHYLGDPAKGLVSSLHAVSPQRRRRPQNRDIGRRREVGIERRPVGGKLREFAAPAERGDDDPAQDDGGHGEQDYGHSMNRAMLGRMVMRAAVRRLPPGTALIAVAHHLAAASAAVAAGADVVDLGAASAELIAAFRDRHPGILVYAAAGPADLVRDPTTARVTGALLVCTDPDAARGSGVPADRVLVDALPAMVAAVNQAGLAALVDADRAVDLATAQDHADRELADGGSAGDDLAAVAGIAAMAAVSSWLGARAVRTRYPLQVRRALDMTASVRGIRPPARAIRGLA